MNRAERRAAQAIDRRCDPEGEACKRMLHRQRAVRDGHVHDTLPLSNAAAARALSKLSPAARRLVMGMVAVTSESGSMNSAFGEAVRAMGDARLSWQVIEELHDAGLMTFAENGAHRLHALFGSIGHRLYEIAHGCDGAGDEGGGGAVLSLPTTGAR